MATYSVIVSDAKTGKGLAASPALKRESLCVTLMRAGVKQVNLAGIIDDLFIGHGFRHVSNGSLIEVSRN